MQVYFSEDTLFVLFSTEHNYAKILMNIQKGMRTMNRIFEDTYNLRAADFDRRRKLRPAAIMDLFQDVAGRHANALGVGLEDLLKKNIVWILVKLRFRVLKDAHMYQRVCVRTWPLPPQRIGYEREYVISDENGEPIVEGSSEWVLMDFTSRKILKLDGLYPLESFCEKRNYEGRFPRLRSFEGEGEVFSFLPPYSDFDMNGHVNNTKYANFVFDALSPDETFSLKEFQMEYHKEVLPGERLNIILARQDGAILARGESDAGEKMFTCRMETR